MEYGNRQRIRDAKRMVGCLNSFIWWDQYIANKTKKRPGRCFVESVMMYGKYGLKIKVRKTSYRQSKRTTYDVVQGNRNREEFAMRKSGE
jgi:hypothetical protein